MESLILILTIIFNNITGSTMEYETSIGYKLKVPYISTINESKNETMYEDNTIINMFSFNLLNNNYSTESLTNGLTKKELNGVTYYYDKTNDYTIVVENEDNIDLKLDIIKGNKYNNLIEDEKYQKLKDSYKMRLAWVKENNSGLKKIYSNIYTYNLELIQFYDYTKVRDGKIPYYYNLEDIFKYNHMTISQIINNYNEIVKLNYGKKTKTSKYTLYQPVDKRLSGEMYYSILVCNNKYIFGSSSLTYSKKIC